MWKMDLFLLSHLCELEQNIYKQEVKFNTCQIANKLFAISYLCTKRQQQKLWSFNCLRFQWSCFLIPYFKITGYFTTMFLTAKNINKLVVYGELVCKIEMHALSSNQAGPKWVMYINNQQLNTFEDYIAPNCH